MGILKRVLFLLGMVVCFSSAVRQCIFKANEARVVSEYRENVLSQDVMGVINIPKIDVLLPIYEGTTETVLQKGVGHVEVSSALGGGRGTHCLLAGHRGLPGKELFTRLGELKEGDLFCIEVNRAKYIYQVLQIRVVRPEETEGLGIWEDRDLVSLITCTPYGINTHRLIVTGERMEERE